jgi:hypothetical protein
MKFIIVYQFYNLGYWDELKEDSIMLKINS